MALTQTERQRKYRQARPTAGENGERRINTWVSTGASLALARLARHRGLTKRQVLEKLLCDADDAISDGLDFESPAWHDYFGTAAGSGAKG